MKYTENYHLPQWVESDRIMMEDFNGAMAVIESGLTEAKAAAAAAGETAAQAKAIGDGLTPRVTAVEKAVKFVKLGELSFSGAGSRTLSLSGIDLSAYSSFLIDGCYAGQSDVRMRINHDSSSQYYEQAGSPGNWGCVLGGGSGENGHSTTSLHPCGRIIASRSQCEILTSTNLWNNSRLTFYAGCSWEAMRSLVFEMSGSGSASLFLYGILA